MKFVPVMALVLVVLMTGPAVIAKEDMPDVVGKSEGPDDTEALMMSPEALKKCRQQCLAFQKTLEDVGDQLETARMEGNRKKKLSILISAVENLVTSMEMNNAACPAMKMRTSKGEEPMQMMMK